MTLVTSTPTCSLPINANGSLVRAYAIAGLGDLCQQRIGERGLAGRCAACNEDILAAGKPKTPEQALAMAKEYFEEWFPNTMKRFEG